MVQNTFIQKNFQMRINIILDKIVDSFKVCKEIGVKPKKLGHDVSISKKPKKNVDVNHYIIFLFQKILKILLFKYYQHYNAYTRE